MLDAGGGARANGHASQTINEPAAPSYQDFEPAAPHGQVNLDVLLGHQRGRWSRRPIATPTSQTEAQRAPSPADVTPPDIDQGEYMLPVSTSSSPTEDTLVLLDTPPSHVSPGPRAPVRAAADAGRPSFAPLPAASPSPVASSRSRSFLTRVSRGSGPREMTRGGGAAPTVEGRAQRVAAVSCAQPASAPAASPAGRARRSFFGLGRRDTMLRSRSRSSGQPCRDSAAQQVDESARRREEEELAAALSREHLCQRARRTLRVLRTCCAHAPLGAPLFLRAAPPSANLRHARDGPPVSLRPPQSRRRRQRRRSAVSSPTTSRSRWPCG